MTMGAPSFLWALALLPLALFGLLQAERRRRRDRDLLVAEALQAAICELPSRRRSGLRMGLLCLALAALLLALARPQWGDTFETVVGQGVDVVIAVDVSDSMQVQDVQGSGGISRLQQAKRDIVDLLRGMQGDRVALVAFAGAAYLQCPLTLDYGAASLFLDDLDPGLIAAKGTALGSGIRAALTAMEGAEHASQAIILITDGEDHGAEALAAAQEAADRRVAIYPIGIGRPEGAPIPLPEGGFHRDAQGQLILSKLDGATLAQIAQLTGGLYTHSMAGELDLERVWRRGIRAQLQAKQQSGSRRQRGEERFAPLVALAFFALAGEALLGERPLSWKRRPPRGGA